MSIFTILTYAMLTLVTATGALALSRQLGAGERPRLRRPSLATSPRRPARGRA